MSIENPVSDQENQEKQKVFFNLGEGKEEDLDEFAKEVAQHGGRLDILMHPFFADYDEARHNDVLRVHKTNPAETSLSRYSFTSKGIKNILKQEEEDSSVPENLRSVVLILQEDFSVPFIKHSLKGREIDLKNKKFFIVPTEEGQGTPQVQGLEKALFADMEPLKEERDPTFVLLAFLEAVGVKHIRLSGGYVMLEPNPGEKDDILNRCLGFFYGVTKLYNDMHTEKEGKAPFDLQLSNFSYPENRTSLERKEKETGDMVL